MVEEFSTPKPAGRFIEFTEAPRHNKLYLLPEAILGIQENDKEGGSCLFITAAPPVLVEQECIQIIAYLALRSKKRADGEPVRTDEPFDDDPTAVKLEGGIEG